VDGNALAFYIVKTVLQDAFEAHTVKAKLVIECGVSFIEAVVCLDSAAANALMELGLIESEADKT
jgi:hypothetical protein